MIKKVETAVFWIGIVTIVMGCLLAGWSTFSILSNGVKTKTHVTPTPTSQSIKPQSVVNPTQQPEPSNQPAQQTVINNTVNNPQPSANPTTQPSPEPTPVLCLLGRCL